MTYNEKKRLGRQTLKWISRIVFILITIVMMYPLIWNVYSSFKTNTEFLADPFALPQGLEWENYVRAFTKSNIGGNLLNSLYVVVLTVLVLCVCAIPCSYALARFRFFGSKLMSTVMMASIFIQATYVMIPLFLQINELGLLNNLTMLGVLYGVNNFAFSIFLLSGFMRAVAKDYEEAAKIDGCNIWQTLIRVVVPLSRSGIITILMLGAMSAWNEYALALVLVSDPAKQTVPIGLARLYEVQQYATDWGALFAALVLVLIPTVIMFAIGQKYLLGGINVGGVKG